MVTLRHLVGVSAYVTKNFSRGDLSRKCILRFKIHFSSSSVLICSSILSVKEASDMAGGISGGISDDMFGGMSGGGAGGGAGV